MCALCDEGYCPRHNNSARGWLEFIPYWTDWREQELEQRETDLGRRDFEQPLGETA
jgi:hypothetical protein